MSIVLIVLFYFAASILNAEQTNQEFSFLHCDITVSDLEGRKVDLCSDQSGDIKFEVQGGNRANSGLMGDMTPVFNNFWRNSLAAQNYTISLTPHLEVSDIWKVHYLGEGGEEISSTFSYFVWSRNFSAPGVGQNDLAIPYSPTRTIKCLREPDSEKPFDACITYYTAVVCESWHNRKNRPVTVVSYPTISVRTENYEASILMMDNFELVQRTAERILNQVLSLSCGN